MGLLELAIIAFLISLIAGGLGFTDVAAGAQKIAKVLFGIFLVIAVVLLILLVLGISIVA
jgi:uncharacterized membrane protein YtjA (UPF0391 family)